MDNKEEMEQNNIQEKDNNSKSDNKKEETNYSAQGDNNEKSTNKISHLEEKENNNQLEEKKSDNYKSKNAQKITQKKEVIIQYLGQIDDKSNKDDKSSRKIKSKEEESDDPFLKAEDEYRKQNCKKHTNIKEKKANSYSKYSHNFRYKSETENRTINNKKLKEKKLTLNLIYSHFKNMKSTRNTEVKYKFKPLIYKNPENLYLKAIQDSELNYLKMKSYNRKTGIFDSKTFESPKNVFLKPKKNFFNTMSSFSNSNNNYNYNSALSQNKILSYIDYIKYNNNKNYTIKNNYNKLNKKNTYLNYETIKTKNANNNNEELSSYKDKDNNNFYSVSANSHLTEKYPIMNNKNKIENKEYILSNKLPEEIKEIKSDNLFKKNIKLSRHKKNNNVKAYSANTNRMTISHYSKNKKTLISSKTTKTTKSKSSGKFLTDKLLFSMNDPENPYSLYFTRNILKKMYKMDIKYNKFELGVPLLSLKHSRKRKRIKFSEKPKERMAKTSYNNFPSGFKTFYSNNNIKKDNKRYFSMNRTGKNFYKK